MGFFAILPMPNPGKHKNTFYPKINRGKNGKNEAKAEQVTH